MTTQLSGPPFVAFNVTTFVFHLTDAHLPVTMKLNKLDANYAAAAMTGMLTRLTLADVHLPVAMYLTPTGTSSDVPGTPSKMSEPKLSELSQLSPTSPTGDFAPSPMMSMYLFEGVAKVIGKPGAAHTHAAHTHTRACTRACTHSTTNTRDPACNRALTRYP